MGKAKIKYYRGTGPRKSSMTLVGVAKRTLRRKEGCRNRGRGQREEGTVIRELPTGENQDCQREMPPVDRTTRLW